MTSVLTSDWCSLPALPAERDSHTQAGLVTCGGYYSDTSCITFSGTNIFYQHQIFLVVPTHQAGPGCPRTGWPGPGPGTAAGSRPRGWWCWGGRPRGPAPPPSCSPPPAGTRSRTSRSNTRHCQSRHESRLLMVDYLIEFQTKVRGDFTITEIVKSSRTFVKTLLPMFLLQASLRYRAGRPGGDHGRQLPLCQPGHGVRGRGLGGGPAQPQHGEV